MINKNSNIEMNIDNGHNMRSIWLLEIGVVKSFDVDIWPNIYKMKSCC